ncbi:phosphate/phosphite/phosphonate ABC transporter substrate-binding protein [Paenibacillus lycopersici]|uniref:Phosphate/phosphite/phosphonate ABC transporter substrate-binding protein n=1 Tax=Paenibacillus lycopersici TaxID=2704462 RepID=A0A6C0G2A0_9BACL|nr:phosphate/phosphite/phosphonate ABC transporter substrate-binding protein [Paenibacillus lycopersici]QHT62937.1 phosphate/phosphite/phosphonate ABC transporter substrate-binding protein [Paenibacillus lycopersici]
MLNIRKKSQTALMLLSIASIVALSACGEKTNTAASNAGASDNAGSSNAAAAADDHKDWPKELNFGFIPSETDGKQNDPRATLAKDMSAALGMKVNLYEGEDYTAVVEAMRTKKIDVALFGPFAYIIAHERSGAEAFAASAKSEDTKFYHSLIVVPADSPAKTLADLKGKTMLFADPASTSGHLFPEMMFGKQFSLKGPDIDKYFSNVSYSGGHDKSIIAISKGQADAAGVCDTCIQKIVDKGLVKTTDYRVIGTSDPIPSSPYAYRNDLPADLVDAIKNFILNYTNDTYLQGNHMFPIGDGDFQVVRDTADTLQMSPDQLLK